MNLPPELKKLYSALKTPAKIQDYVNTLLMRQTGKEPYVQSPLLVAQTTSATCMEGALFALSVLSAQKYQAWLLDLKVDPKNTKDVDHVIAVFKQNGYYGAISKTAHAVLRYREPIYKTVRELVLSYFHEYFLDDGTKTLRSYSKLFSIPKKYRDEWVLTHEDLFELAFELDVSPHYPIIPKHAIRTLRKADRIEITAGKIT